MKLDQELSGRSAHIHTLSLAKLFSIEPHGAGELIARQTGSGTEHKHSTAYIELRLVHREDLQLSRPISSKASKG
jgi:hypothetical protein